jgi:hypothetical protein
MSISHSQGRLQFSRYGGFLSPGKLVARMTQKPGGKNSSYNRFHVDISHLEHLLEPAIVER